MNYDSQSIIQNELDSNEKLIWAGIPKQGTIFRRSDVFMIPFSLLWGGFAISWEIVAIGMSSEKAGAVSSVFPLFGIPLIIFCLYMIFGRFIYDSKKRTKTFYGLTDQRAIIVSGIFNKNVKSLSLKTMSDVSLSENSNGHGTITFGHANLMTFIFTGGGFTGMGGSNVPKFELIKNAKQVYDQLIAQQKS